MKKIDTDEKAKIEKKFVSLFDIVLIPSAILIAYTILNSTFQKWIYLASTQVQTSISILGIILQVACFSYIGFKLTKTKLEKSSISLLAGLVSGVIVSFVGAIIGIISVYLFPSSYAYAMDLLLEQGFSKEIILANLQIASWINLIVGPIVLGIIGAVISWISFLIFKKID